MPTRVIKCGARRLKLFPQARRLGGDHSPQIALDRQHAKADIFAHRLDRLVAGHPDDRQVLRQIRIGRDVIDTLAPLLKITRKFP